VGIDRGWHRFTSALALSTLKLVQGLIKLPVDGRFIPQYPIHCIFTGQIGAAKLGAQVRHKDYQQTELPPSPEVLVFLG